MFGIDAYTFEVVWPSLLGIVGMTAAMVWGYIKVRELMSEEPKDK